MKFDQLEALRKAAWEAIASRREFEWRVNLSFWGLLVAFIGAVKFESPSKQVEEPWLFLVPAILCIAHAIWLFGLWKAFQIDKEEESDLRAAMRSRANYRESSTVAEARAIAIRGRGAWNHIPQFLTTWLLTCVAVYIILENFFAALLIASISQGIGCLIRIGASDKISIAREWLWLLSSVFFGVVLLPSILVFIFSRRGFWSELGSFYLCFSPIRPIHVSEREYAVGLWWAATFTLGPYLLLLLGRSIFWALAAIRSEKQEAASVGNSENG